MSTLALELVKALLTGLFVTWGVLLALLALAVWLDHRSRREREEGEEERRP